MLQKNKKESRFKPLVGAAAVASASLLLIGCSSTPAELEGKATPIVQTYPENYQEIYRRVSTAAKQCVTQSMSVYSHMRISSELYSDLGYGEISASSQSALGSSAVYWSARIDREGKTSKLTLRSPNTVTPEQSSEPVLRWAKGDTNC